MTTLSLYVKLGGIELSIVLSVTLWKQYLQIFFKSIHEHCAFVNI